MMPKRKTKEKRVIPLREAGEVVNPQQARPSQLLFDQVLRAELDSQTIDDRIAEEIGSGLPNQNNLDSQTETLGNPSPALLDSQNTSFGQPEQLNLDSQTENFGNPKTKTLDIGIAENEKRISKEAGNLDSKISKKTKTDSQTEEKKTEWKKYDTKRKAKGVFLRTSDEITKKFKQFCIEKDWEFSYGTEIAWNKLMADLDIQTEKDLDSLIALDERRLKMMFKSKPFIINLYLRYNTIFNELSATDGKGKWSARWSPRDDEAAKRYNDLPPAIVELGILQTQLNKGFGASRIQTFKYYTDEIEKVIASGVSDETLKMILDYHRNIWKGQTKREVDLGFLEEVKVSDES